MTDKGAEEKAEIVIESKRPLPSSPALVQRNTLFGVGRKKRERTKNLLPDPKSSTETPHMGESELSEGSRAPGKKFNSKNREFMSVQKPKKRREYGKRGAKKYTQRSGDIRNGTAAQYFVSARQQ